MQCSVVLTSVCTIASDLLFRDRGLTANTTRLGRAHPEAEVKAQ